MALVRFATDKREDISVDISRTIATGRRKGFKGLSKIGNIAGDQASINFETSRKIILKIAILVSIMKFDSIYPTKSMYS